MIFNFQKKLVKKLGLNWLDWFYANYGRSNFRTVNDDMRLAKIPNIIRYAALGKERLLQIVRQLEAKSRRLTPLPITLRSLCNGLNSTRTLRWILLN